MTVGNGLTSRQIEVVDYDPEWPNAYQDERIKISQEVNFEFEHFEHIGSTSVPGLASKPIIDMMAAIPKLDMTPSLELEILGYRLAETGMIDRLFMLRQEHEGLRYHLHIVETASWAERKERHLRDYLRANPKVAEAYGTLKRGLASTHRADPLAYTRAKTEFLQKASDAIRDAQNLPRIDVWKE